MVASAFSSDLQGWAILVTAVGGVVIGLVNTRGIHITRGHAADAKAAAGKAADTVVEVKVDQAKIMVALSNYMEQQTRHLDQTARIIPAIEVNQQATLSLLKERLEDR